MFIGLNTGQISEWISHNFEVEDSALEWALGSFWFEIMFANKVLVFAESANFIFYFWFGQFDAFEFEVSILVGVQLFFFLEEFEAGTPLLASILKQVFETGIKYIFFLLI